jgi:hypothetical protein
VPQTNTAPPQQPATPPGFGQAQGALDALGGYWLPAALVLVVLLAGAAYLLWPRRKRSATLWTEDGGWVSIPDAEAATPERFQLTEAAARARVLEEDIGLAPSPGSEVPLDVPAPAPAAESPAEEPPVPTPLEPVAVSAIPPLVPNLASGLASGLAPSAAAATSGDGAVAMRSPAPPTPSRSARTRPHHRPELKVHHHQTGGPPDAGPPHSPEAALRRFVEDWSGVPLEADGDPHPSMALLRAYAGQVLGRPPVWGAPVEIPDTYDMDHYVWVRESPYRVPSPGDAVVWAPRPQDAHDGGHVAIFIKGDASGFDAFDASGSVPAVRHHADYGDVVGWLHPIGG